MDHSLLATVLVLLALGTVLVALFRWLGLSPILGYLATGIVAGPHVLGLLTDSPLTHLLAELGVVFLMFTIGLEFSLPRLLAAKRLVLGLGGSQVVLTSLLFGVAAWGLGLPPAGAAAVGGALAMSSTAISLKQLGEQLELPADHGRAALGILLFQDLATVPFLVMLTALAGDRSGVLAELAGKLLIAAIVFVLLAVLGRKLLPSLLAWVARTRSLELFMLTALLLALSAAGISELMGLSPALGAFMAGMLLGESPFRHQVEADVRPFRDLMLGLFFATIGMQLDLPVFAGSLHWIVLGLGIFLPVKGLLLFALARLFGSSSFAAWRTAVTLAHGGEFGLLLLSMALGLSLAPEAVIQPVLAIVILSMALAPVLIRFNAPLADALPGGGGGESFSPDEHIAEAGADFADHVVVCGYGRVGQGLAAVLAREEIPVLALDLDPERIRQARQAEEPVLFADASRADVLRAAGVERARAVAVTFDDPEAALKIAGHLRVLPETPPLLVRSRGTTRADELVGAGAEIFPEGQEASLMFTAQLLLLIGIPHSKVETMLAEVRADDYALLRGSLDISNEQAMDRGAAPEQLRTITLGENDAAAGRTADEVGLEALGVELLDVRRAGIRVPGRLLDTRLRAGDVLVLRGAPEALGQAMRTVRQGR